MAAIDGDAAKWNGRPFGTSGGVVTWNLAGFATAFNQLDFRLVEPGFAALVSDAFDAWEAVLDIDLVQIAPDADADIQVGWQRIDGPGGTLGVTGTEFRDGELLRAAVRLDVDEDWTLDRGFLPRFRGDPSNFYAVAAHEIGHALGLDHLSDPRALMHPTSALAADLTLIDIRVGVALYGAAKGAGAPGGQILLGGAGRDDLRGGPGDDEIYGLRGRDLLRGDDGDDLLFGGEGADRLSGGAGDDRLAGGHGHDRLEGGQGDDRLEGGAGADLIQGGAGADAMVGGHGGDRLQGGAGDDRLAGGRGHDRLEGGRGEDRLIGGGGRDALNGGAEGDVLAGGAGADRLNGGRGDDLLIGGTGRDVFILIRGGGRDEVRDYRDGIDRLEIATGAAGFAELTIGAVNGHATVSSGGGTLLLLGVDADVLDPADFAF